MPGPNWEWSPEAVERSQAKARSRQAKRATDERYPRWNAGEVTGAIKRLSKIGVEESRILCFLDFLHSLDQGGPSRPGELAKVTGSRGKVDHAALLAAIDRAWSVRPIDVVYGGLPTLGKDR